MKLLRKLLSDLWDRNLFPVIHAELHWRSGRQLSYIRHKAAWEKHAWSQRCAPCYQYASGIRSVADGNIPCARGRKMIDRMFPATASERLEYYRRHGFLQ